MGDWRTTVIGVVLALVASVFLFLMGYAVGSGGDEETSGMCESTIMAVAELAAAPELERPSALNRVWETDMECR